ncbi:FkbM family methyltransferase [Actinokineospora auranticolor]|uniref:FkbM family methyltransferase n=1 Tax=Actinokineospora auranticolor TaxID=155976 RepID=A0A2S6GMD9_9PSEU|nr:FkbM family methyltransferase [Actinokineospora auranticolor]PPK66326.1 FkbM family methyltransferase [Actinokineospora auranticolor]
MTGPRSATLPRPALRVGRPAPVRVGLAHGLARAHARITRGSLSSPVLAVLDRVLPRGPLPPVAATLAPGVSLRVEGALARTAVVAAGHEHREAEILTAALRPGGVFVDVGAHVGWLSLLIAAHRPDTFVWALEPVPLTADALGANLAASGLSTVELIRVAAGPRRASAWFTTHPDSSFAHQSDIDPVRGALPETGEVRCPVLPLDELWAHRGWPRVDAVKVDVEGAEPDVLRGATTLLTRDRPLLVVDAPTGYARADLAERLAPLGYRQHRAPGMHPRNIVFHV